MKLSVAPRSWVGPSASLGVVRLGQTYRAYLQRFFAKRESGSKTRPMSHLCWTRAVRAIRLQRVQEQRLVKLDLCARKDKLAELRFRGSNARFGLGYIPSWGELRKRAPCQQPVRSQVLFVKSSVYCEKRMIIHSKVDPTYHRRLYLHNFSVALAESYPGCVVNSLKLVYRRAVSSRCLDCGEHRWDGLFCCLRNVDRLLDALRKDSEYLRFAVRLDPYEFDRTVALAERLWLQRSRILVRQALLFTPYTARIFRASSLAQDVIRISAAVGGLALPKFTKSRVVKEVASLVTPSPKVVLFDLFGVKLISFLYGLKLPILDHAFLNLVEVCQVRFNFETFEMTFYHVLSLIVTEKGVSLKPTTRAVREFNDEFDWLVKFWAVDVEYEDVYVHMLYSVLLGRTFAECRESWVDGDNKVSHRTKVSWIRRDVVVREPVFDPNGEIYCGRPVRWEPVVKESFDPVVFDYSKVWPPFPKLAAELQYPNRHGLRPDFGDVLDITLLKGAKKPKILSLENLGGSFSQGLKSMFQRPMPKLGWW